jgi:hypothetical protein
MAGGHENVGEFPSPETSDMGVDWIALSEDVGRRPFLAK